MNHIFITPLAIIFNLLAVESALAQALPKAEVSALSGQKIPSAQEAFKVEINAVRDGKIVLDVFQQPSTYLYKDKFKFSLTPASSAAKLGVVQLPPAATVNDDVFGKVAVYRGPQIFEIPYSGSGAMTLNVQLQGCHELAKICYPPQSYDLKVNLAQPAASKKAATAASLEIAENKLTSPKTQTSSFNKQAIVVKNKEQLTQALTAAKGKWVMVDVWAGWCVPCKWMENNTLSAPQVSAELEKEFVVVKADVTASGAASAGLLSHFSIPGPPAFVFYSPNGVEVGGARVLGTQTVEKFMAQLKLVRS